MSIQIKKYYSKKLKKEIIKYFAVVYDAENTKYIWSEGFAKETDAKICEGELLKALKSQQVAINNGNICFDELMGLWLKKAKKCYSNSTYRAYEWYAEKYLMPVFHGKMMRKITAKIIQKFADGFSEKYSAETTNKCLNILSDLFQYGMEYACINYNPVFKVKRKKVTVKEIGTWRESHIQKFLAYEKVKASRYYELLILSFSTGLRPSEVCGLADWMLKGNTLYIERGYDQYNAVSNLKTQRSHRRLILPHDLVEILATGSSGKSWKAIKKVMSIMISYSNKLQENLSIQTLIQNVSNACSAYIMRSRQKSCQMLHCMKRHAIALEQIWSYIINSLHLLSAVSWVIQNVSFKHVISIQMIMLSRNVIRIWPKYYS